MRVRKMTSTVVEYIGGIEVIKAFNQSANSYQKYSDAVEDNAAYAVNWMKSVQLYKSMLVTIWPSVLVCVLPIGCVLYRNGSLSVPAFVTCIVLSLGIITPILNAMNFTDSISQMKSVVGELCAVLMKKVYQAARDCGCYDFILNLENGFNTVVGGAGGHLSGGERQRIAIARAVLKNAPIVILDEATAYIDAENEALIQEAMAKVIAGKTVLMIAHRLSTITDADKIVVIKDGQIIDEGTHENLLTSCTLYQEMWKAHMDTKDVA